MSRHPRTALLAVALLGIVSCSGRRPLPESALRAQISVSAPPARLHVDETVTVDARVKNLGDEAWPAAEKAGTPYGVFLSYHFVRVDGTESVHDGWRTPLPAKLAPGQEVLLHAKVQAPSQPGPYTLVLDMVQEEVAWFRDRGSETPKLKVAVE